MSATPIPESPEDALALRPTTALPRVGMEISEAARLGVRAALARDAKSHVVVAELLERNGQVDLLLPGGDESERRGLRGFLKAIVAHRGQFHLHALLLRRAVAKRDGVPGLFGSGPDVGELVGTEVDFDGGT